MFKVGDVVKIHPKWSNQTFYKPDFFIILDFDRKRTDVCVVDKIITFDNLINVNWLQHLDDNDIIKLRQYKINKLLLNLHKL